MPEIRWWCGKCQDYKPGKMQPGTVLQPGVDPPGANPKCPDCATKMMPRVTEKK